jgi:signal transduction histidine kinase
MEALLMISRSIAHDLRSPLSTITLLLAKAKFSTSEQKQLVLDSLNRLDSITENLLKKYSNSPVDLAKTNIFDLVKKLIQEKAIQNNKIRFENNIDTELSIETDLVSLERIFSNILDNSVHALKDRNDGLIQVSSTVNQNTVQIRILDNGPGIPKVILDLIGKEQVSTKGIEGNGIGLLNSIRLLEKMRGHFDISSSSSNGTSILLTIPKNY